MENDFVKVKVHPNAEKEELVKKDDRYIVKVREKAKEGRANKRVKVMLSSLFPNKNPQLIKGYRSKNKIFKLHNNEIK